MVATTSHTQIPPTAIDLARPMVEGLALTASEVRERVVKTGRTGRGGAFSQYAAKSRRRGAKRFYQSGTMWDSLRVRQQTPLKATANFSGKAAVGRKTTKKGKRVKISNQDLGRILQSKEDAAILEPSAKEAKDLTALLRGALSEQAIEALGFEAKAFQASRRERSVQRRAKRVLRSMKRPR